MSSLKKRIMSLLLVAAVMFSGASAIAISIQGEEANLCPVESLSDLPDRPGRF